LGDFSRTRLVTLVPADCRLALEKELARKITRTGRRRKVVVFFSKQTVIKFQRSSKTD
jgi:hypothetical protein